MAPFYHPDAEVLSKQYWDRPASKNIGDASIGDTYLAVGAALSEWERAEEGLADLFLNLVEDTRASSSPVRRAFGAIESSSGRRKVILAAAAAYFGQNWEDKNIRLSFFRVVEAVGFASKRRDDIAHGTVQDIRLDDKRFGAFLLPPNYNTERTKAYMYLDQGDPLYFTFTDFRYTSADINTFTAKFQKLKMSITYLAGFIRKLDDGTILFVNALRD